MNRIGRFQGKNVMAFKEIDIDWDKPGLSLILGRNLDDVRGNDSRNATGKSSLFKALEAHLFNTAAGLKQSEIVTDTVGKDMESVLEWSPAKGKSHHSYQYFKHGDWGSDVYIYSGGTSEDWEAGVEGVEDVSWDDKRDTQSAIPWLLNTSYDEWTLLSAILDVGNDDIHPFFASNRANRLELVQNLYGLNYMQVHEANKQEMKAVKQEIDSLGVSIQSQLELIQSQLDELPAENDIVVEMTVAEAEVAKLEKKERTLTSRLGNIEESRNTLRRYNQLHNELTSAQCLERDLAKELSDARQGMQQTQEYVSYLAKLKSDIESLHAKQATLEDIRVKLGSLSAQDMSLEELNAQVSTLNAEHAELNQRKQALTSLAPALASVLEHLPEWTTLATGEERQQAVADLSSRVKHSLNALEVEAPDHDQRQAELTAELTALQTHLGQWQEYRHVVDALEAKQIMGWAKGFKSSAELTARQQECQQHIQDLHLGIQRMTMEAHHLRVKADEDEQSLENQTCPTCNQEWIQHKPEELAEIRAEIQANRAKAYDLEQAMERDKGDLSNHTSEKALLADLAQIISGSRGELFWSLGSEKADDASRSIQLYSQQIETLQAALQEVQGELARMAEREQALRPLLPHLEKIQQLAAQHGAQLLIEQGEAVDQRLSRIANQVADVKACQYMIGERDKVQGEIEALKLQISEQQGDAWIGNLEQLAASHANNVTNIQQFQQFIAWAEHWMPAWQEMRSDRFANIEQVRQALEGLDIEQIESNLQQVTQDLGNWRNRLHTATTQHQQRSNLERRYGEIKSQSSRLTELQQMLRVKQAVQLLSGPRGLMVKRTQLLFERINLLLNQYLNVLIQDGLTKDRALEAYLEMSNNSVDLNIYRAGIAKSKRSLSASEKARVKLALTLAMREVAPPNKLTNVLLLDELDASSCETNAGRIWDCISMYLERNPNVCVWAVSHSSAVQQSGIWKNIYEVVKQDGIATLTCLTENALEESA